MSSPSAGLSPAVLRALRAPFPAEQIKWKIQVSPREGDTWALVVAYVDARDVAERLDVAAAGDWSDAYGAPPLRTGSWRTLECRLTVCGVTRCDVGAALPPADDAGDVSKDVYSDAFKRAAVKFGVAAHVYRFPQVKAQAERFGRSWYLTFAAQRELHDLACALVAGQAPPRGLSAVKIFGSALGADGGLPPAPPCEPPPDGDPVAAPPSPTAPPARPPAVPRANGRAPDPARAATARAALASAEARVGVAPARPGDPVATLATPPAPARASIAPTSVQANGAQLRQIAATITAIKHAYGRPGLDRVADLGIGVGLLTLETMGERQLADAHLSRDDATRLLGQLTDLTQSLDAATIHQAAYDRPR